MKLAKLWIEDFKNLKDVEINFDQGELVTVVIGWNGAGKSNVIEALVVIFRDLDLGGLTPFSYRLEYICHGKRIHINADKEQKTADKQYQIKYCDADEIVNEESWNPLRFSKLNNKNADKFLPSNVFGYYSGPSDRLATHFYEHQRKFRDQLLYPKKHKLDEKTLPLRPLFYAQKVHSNFVLLSFFLGQDQRVKGFLKDKLNIEGLESVLFVLKKPDWTSKKGDPRFWNATGVVRPFLDRLFSASLAPIKKTIKVPHPMKNPENVDALFLYLKDLEALRQVGENTSDKDFFKLLESIYFSNLIHEVRIRVRIKDENGDDDSLTFRELSEGEQQLLTVLGLLRFTRNEESLFLLDEPDTHLNPSWSMEYLNYLQEVAGLDEYVNEKGNSHIVLATHDPIVISTLKKEQIQIMRRDEGTLKVISTPPQNDPKGLGVTGILMSDMFGLRSDLDPETLELLDIKARLASKEGDELTPEDIIELERVNGLLEPTGFLESYADPYFSQFIKAFVNEIDMKRFQKPFLSDYERGLAEGTSFKIAKDMEE